VKDGRRLRVVRGSFPPPRTWTQIAWSAADQGLVSVSNFLVALLVGRWLGPEEYGVFALCYALWVAAMAFSRSAVVQPFVVAQRSDASANRADTGFRSLAMSATILLAVGTAMVVCFAAIVSSAPMRTPLLALAAGLPALLVQDAWRLFNIAGGRASHALLSDWAWTTATLTALVVLQRTGTLTPTTAVLAWSGGAFLGAVPAWLARGGRFAPRKAARALRESLPLIRGFASAEVLYQIGLQAVLWITAALLTPAAVGLLRAAQTLLMPPRLMVMAGEFLVLPRVADRGRSSGLRLAAHYALLNAGATLGWGVLLVAAWTLGKPPLETVFGTPFSGWELLLVPLLLQTLFASIGQAAGVALKGHRRSRALVRLAASMLVVRLALVSVGIWAYGLWGAAWAIALADLIQLLFGWWAAARTPEPDRRRTRTSQAG
jgi:O-antigen/teichoic acid export membrane protein